MLKFFLCPQYCTDKKIVFASYNSLEQNIDKRVIRHGDGVLGWDKDRFEGNVRDRMPYISDDGVDELFAMYEESSEQIIKNLKKEAQELTEKMERVRKFDFIATEKRIARIEETIKKFTV